MTSGALPQASVSLTRVFTRWQRLLTSLIILLVVETALAAFIRVRVLTDLLSGEVLSPLAIVSSVGLLLLAPMLFAVVRTRIAQKELHLLVQSEQESVNAIRTLLDTTTEGICAIDTTGVCIMANRAAGQFLGYPPEELLGQNLHQLIHHTRADGSVYPVQDCPIHRTMSESETHSVEDDVFWKKAGTSFAVSYSAAPIMNGNGIQGAVISFRNIEERKEMERAIHEAEQQTQMFLRDLPLGVFITDEAGSPIYSNRKGAELLGLPADPSLKGADLSHAYQVYVAGTDDLYDPAGLPVARALTGETMTVEDIEIHRPDGTVMPLEVWAGPIRDVEGTIRYAAATFSDISVRKKVAAELKEQAEMLDLVEDAVIALDTSNRITYWNRTATLIYGWTKEEALGRVSYELLRTTFPVPREEIKRQLFENGRWEGELRHVRKDGKDLVVASRWVLRRDEAAHPTQILEVNNDITEQKRSQEERVREQELLSAIFETSPDIIATITSNLQLTYVNAAARQILGYEFEELFGENSLHWVHPDDLHTAASLLEAAFSADETGRSRLRVKNAGGEWMWLDIRIRAMSGSNDTAVVIARDVTDQVELEEGLEEARHAADEANVAKSEFLSRMSHELRTPLNGVLGFAQLLDMDATTESQKEAAGEIVKAGRHLLDLINEVLDIAAIEARQLPLSLEPVDAMEVAEECVSLLAPLATDEGITLEIETQKDGHQHPHVVADRQRLKQVLLNLISNGIKYNRDQGLVKISFSLDDELQVGIDVFDTGRGISTEKLPQLFVAFDRLGAEASGIEGTGLGLSLAKSLVEAMGGTLTVASEPGTGTAFTVVLTRAADTAEGNLEEAPSESEAAAAATHTAKSAAILYIEDNLSNMTLVERLMQRRPNIQLIPAMQGGLGLTLARKQDPDLILLDVNLPDMSGLDVLRRLQADPHTAEIPVVMLSADATSNQINRFREAGARDYLTKPIDIHRFYAVVDEHCGETQTNDPRVNP